MDNAARTSDSEPVCSQFFQISLISDNSSTVLSQFFIIKPDRMFICVGGSRKIHFYGESRPTDYFLQAELPRCRSS
jgi:hypothetical protein